MKAFVAILSVLAVAAAEIDWTNVRPRHIGPRDLPSSRITGGKEVQPHSLPYQVALLLETPQGQGFCGGSLIDREWVLTAAHCIDGVNSVQVILGAHNVKKDASEEPGRVEIKVPKSNLLMHERYSASTIENDIALIRLPEPVALSETIQTIALPRKSDAKNKFEKRRVTASGWGRPSDSQSTISATLNSIDTTVMSLSTCKFKFLFIVKDTNVCIAGEDGKSTCNGDSGGPLTAYEADGTPIVIGATSFGLASSCEKVHPAVFTHVPSYLNWIEQRTGLQLRD